MTLSSARSVRPVAKRHKSLSTLSPRPVPRRPNSARHSLSCRHARHIWPRRRRNSTNSESRRSDAVSTLDARPWWSVAGTGARWARRVCAPSRESTVLPRMAPTVSCVAFTAFVYQLQNYGCQHEVPVNAFPSSYQWMFDRGKPVAPVRGRVVRVLSLVRCSCARIPSFTGCF